MKYPYCLPILKSSKSEILATVQKHTDDYAYFEVWLDYVDELDTTFVKKLAADLPERLVVVFRRQQLAPIQMSLEQRYQLLDSLQDSSVLVDLDITSQQAEIEYLRQKDYKLATIISYHNYQETPADDQLQDILLQIRKPNPTILKIATECQNEGDALRLLQLLLTIKKSREKCIISGMGKPGLITRIFGALWGNELVFAPADSNEQSAPGQLTRNQLDNILQSIGE